MGKQEANWEDNLSDADKKSLAAIREANRKITEMAPKPEEPVGPTVPSPHSIRRTKYQQHHDILMERELPETK